LMRSIRELERSQKYERVPALALTAFARTEDRKRAAAAGFDAHLPKPVDPQQLLYRIGLLIAQHQ
jgi:CheY-like chemotaxis protein